MLFLLTWIENTDKTFNKAIVKSLYEKKTICNYHGITKLIKRLKKKDENNNDT